MKIWKKATVPLVMVSTLIAGNANAEDRRDFWILNETGRTISEIHLAAHGYQDSPWGADILTDADLPSGLGTKVFFFQHGPCVIDFRIVYSDGSREDYTQGRNLCAASAIEFSRGSVNYALFLPGTI